MPNLENILKLFPESIRSKLSGIEEKEFSENGYLKLQGLIEDYVNNLVSESVAVSKRHGVDVVSELHVTCANSSLISQTKNKLYDAIILIGGILVGVGGSGFYPIITGTYTTSVIESSFVFTFLGIIFLAIGYRH